MRLWRSRPRRPPDPGSPGAIAAASATDAPPPWSGPRPAARRWSEDEILGVLLDLERVDLALTEEQARAAAGYARTHARRFALVLEAFAPLIPPGARIFSMGSMPNQLEVLFAHFLGAAVIGSTHSPADRRDKFTAVYRGPEGSRFEIEVYLRDLTRDRFPLDAFSCDAVLCFEMVEHMAESPLPALREARRVLRPGGHLLLSTPNMQHWHRLLYAINGLTYPDVDFREPAESRHLHIFSFRELRDLLAAAGLVVERHFFADPWNSARHFERFDLSEPLNRAVHGARLAREEFGGECVFIAARPVERTFVLSEGWHRPEHDGDDWWCWTAGRGRVRLFAEREGRAVLRAEMQSIPRPNRVDVLMNGEPCQVVELASERGGQIQIEAPLAAGDNVIEFASARGGVTLPTDSRTLAIAVRNLTITAADGGVYRLLEP